MLSIEGSDVVVYYILALFSAVGFKDFVRGTGSCVSLAYLILLSE